MPYIKLYRALATSPLWTKEPFTRGQAWADLLLLANYAPGHLRVRGNRIEIPQRASSTSSTNDGQRDRLATRRTRKESMTQHTHPCPGGFLGTGPGEHMWSVNAPSGRRRCLKCDQLEGDPVADDVTPAMEHKVKKTRCPRCGSKCNKIKGGRFQCSRALCGALTDGVDDGDIGCGGNPAARMMREESRGRR